MKFRSNHLREDKSKHMKNKVPVFIIYKRMNSTLAVQSRVRHFVRTAGKAAARARRCFVTDTDAT